MSTLIDTAAYAANEIYQIEATDRVEGAADGASFDGLGISNQPHQQLANRTAFLKQRQDNNIAAIGVLQGFAAKFVSSLQTNGYIKIPVADVTRGAVTAIIEWGYHPLSAAKIANDVTFTVTWPLAFPNAILAPPLATNVYQSTSGFNVAAAVISYSKTGATFVLDVPGGTTLGTTNERSNGLSWLAIGF